MQERRRERRFRVLKQARVMLSESVFVDCVVRDLSPSGARLEFDRPLYLPPEFQLQIISAELTVPAAPAWQRNCEAGVRFVGVGTVGKVDNTPKRIVPTAA